MKKFKDGDKVKTTEAWLDRWIAPEQVSGAVAGMRPVGLASAPKRTVLVKLDKPIGPFNKVWFDPKDLEPVK